MNKIATAFIVVVAILALVCLTQQTDALFQKRTMNDFIFDPSQNAVTSKKFRAVKDHPEQWFTAYVDNFDPLNLNTYQQRFFENTDFFNASQPGAPILIELGCEGPLSAKWVTDYAPQSSSTQVEWAKKTGGLLLALEHRYYGKSQPFNGKWTVDNLRFLTMEQALADAALFIREYVIPKFSPLQNNPVFVFGGSYGGTMVSSMAQYYPNFVHGAIAASGVYQPKVDLTEFLDEVIRDITVYAEDNGTCVNNIASATKFLADALDSRDQKQLDYINKMFPVSTPFTINDPELDRQSFWAQSVDNFIMVVQYNKEGSPSYYSVTDMCRDFAKAKNPQERFEVYANVHRQSVGDAGYKWRFAEFVAEIGDINYTDESQNMRQWFWQTATQFGWYQGLTPTTAPVFGGGKIQYTNDFFFTLFQNAFDSRFTEEFISVATRRQRAKNGEYLARQNNIIYTAGDEPWNTLWLPNYIPERQVTSYYINKTSHCAILYAAQSYDPQSLITARNSAFNDFQKMIANFQIVVKDNKIVPV